MNGRPGFVLGAVLLAALVIVLLISFGAVIAMFSYYRNSPVSSTTWTPPTTNTVSVVGTGSCPNTVSMPLTNPALRGSAGQPRVIILHYIGSGMTPTQVFNYFNSGSDGRHVFVQYLVGHDGAVYQFAPDNRSDAGAGGYNRPAKDYGPGAISISIENEGNFESSNSSLRETTAQIKANIDLVSCLMKKYSIPKNNSSIISTNPRAQEPYNIISHEEADARGNNDKGVRGGRRSDPGARFLAEVMNGIK